MKAALRRCLGNVNQPTEGETMPQIIVKADHEDGSVTLRERVNVADFDSDRFAANLVERLGWAVLDAVEDEHETTRGPQPRVPQVA